MITSKVKSKIKKLMKKEGNMSETTSKDLGEIRAQNIKNFFIFIILISLIGGFTAIHLVELNLNNKHIRAIAEHHCDECLLKLFPKSKSKKKPQVEIRLTPPEGPQVIIK